MIYETPADWTGAAHRRVSLFGMSGLGKTRIAAMLREEADWFHYSIDFRIGTRYMGEHIVDNFKREAMRNPFLRQLLRSDSIYIASNITFHNLEPLSTYLGKPGDPAKGGIPFDEYILRQRQHREAEISATRDTLRFIEKAEAIYGYRHFVCDTSGSLCEVVDPDDPADPVMTDLSGRHAPGLVPRHRGRPRGPDRPLREGAEADVLPGGLPDPPLARVPGGRGLRAGGGRPRRLHPPRIPRAHGPPAAALRRHGRPLGRDRRGRRGRAPSATRRTSTR